MLNLGNLIGMLITLVLLGMGGAKLLKTVEAESAKMAVEAHRQGYISAQGFHERLVQGN